MKKRILSWILLLCMLVALAPAAYADEYVSELIISGIPVPRGGDKAVQPAELLLSHGRVTSFRWYDSGMAEMSASDSFSAGKAYRFEITVAPDAGTSWGSKFSMSTLTQETTAEFKLTLISKNGVGMREDSLSVSANVLRVAGTVICEAAKEKKDSVEIVPTAAYLPEAGKLPNTKDYLISNGNGAWSCRWHDNTAGRDMEAAEVFAAGHSYSVYFYISPDSEWEWKEKSDGRADVTVKFITDEKTGAFVTDTTPSLSYEIDGTKLAVGFEFDCPSAEEAIASIEITPKGVWFPIHGNKPTGKDDYTVNRNCVLDSVVWRDEQADSYLTAAGTFEGGKQYEVTFTVIPPKGYGWDDPSKMEILLIDGEGGGWMAKSFSFEQAGDTRKLKAVYSFKAVEAVKEELPAKVIVTCSKQPVAGQNLPFDGITVNAGEVVNVTWTDYATGDFVNMTEQGAVMKAEAGHEYALAVQIKPPAGNAWPYRTDENQTQWFTLPVQVLMADGTEKPVRMAFVSGWAPGTQIEVLRVVVSFELEDTAKPAAIEFSDVDKSAWYYDWVYQAVELGLINGKGKNASGRDYFDPAGNITLAEAVKLAACMHQLYYDGAVSLKNGDPWYASYADYAEWSAGILVSWDGPGFSSQSVMANPNKIISRAEFAWIFARSLPAEALAVINNIPDNSVPDVKIAENRYYEEIYTLYRAGILNGKDDKGTFKPGDSIQRSEVAAIVVRMMKAEKRVGAPAKLGQ